MAAGVTDRLWEMSDPVAMIEASEANTETGCRTRGFVMQPETICDLPMVKAEYLWIEHKTTPAGNGFRIRFSPGAHGIGQIVDVDETRADQFATEIEALAALIRARLLRLP